MTEEMTRRTAQWHWRWIRRGLVAVFVVAGLLSFEVAPFEPAVVSFATLAVVLTVLTYSLTSGSGFAYRILNRG